MEQRNLKVFTCINGDGAKINIYCYFMRSCYFNDLLYRIAFVHRVALGAFDVDIDEFQANFKGKSANHISNISIAANGRRLTGLGALAGGRSGYLNRRIRHLVQVNRLMLLTGKTRVSPA